MSKSKDGGGMVETGSNWKMACEGHVLRLILNASSLSVITVKIHEDIYSGFASMYTSVCYISVKVDMKQSHSLPSAACQLDQRRTNTSGKKVGSLKTQSFADYGAAARMLKPASIPFPHWCQTVPCNPVY